MDLEKWLREYDKVFLIEPCDKSEKLLLKMLRYVDRMGRRDRVLFLDRGSSMDGVKHISAAEYQYFWTLYHMYECSDRFQVITDSSMYGSLLNYVDTGVLTMEEAAEALLQ